MLSWQYLQVVDGCRSGHVQTNELLDVEILDFATGHLNVAAAWMVPRQAEPERRGLVQHHDRARTV